MTQLNLDDFVKTPEDLLALAPEDLAGIILEIVPTLLQHNGLFGIGHIIHPVYQSYQSRFPFHTKQNVTIAIAEALSWLVSQGLVIPDPDQPTHWYRLTRKGSRLPTRTDVEVFRKGAILQAELLPESFAQKVVPLFRRGDYDTAVFQAFKEVEVSVRKTANVKGARYSDSEIGVSLMRKAFHPDSGPLTDMGAVPAEREAIMHLFSGAIGSAKNPTSHREVAVKAHEAARLIIFAAHLLDLVRQ